MLFRSVNIKVKYTLEAGTETRVLNVHFTTKELGIDPIGDSGIYLSQEGEDICLNYNFENKNKRLLSIYNTTGNKIAERELRSDETGILLPKVPPGIYIYSITEKNKIIKSGKYRKR